MDNTFGNKNNFQYSPRFHKHKAYYNVVFHCIADKNTVTRETTNLLYKFIKCKILEFRLLTFIPRVLHTSSEIACMWLPWKWIAMRNNISPNEELLPEDLKIQV